MKMSYYSRLNYARTIASNHGLTLVESSTVSVPHTDGKNIYVPFYEPSWAETSDEEVEWWGMLLHEIYHNDEEKGHSEHFPLLRTFYDECKKRSKLWKKCTNLLEDLRIEKREYGDLPGQDGIMDKLRAKTVRDLRKSVDSGKIKALSPSEQALFLMQTMAFLPWQRGVMGHNPLSWEWSAEAMEKWGKIAHMLPTVTNINDSIETFVLTDELLALLHDDSDPEEEEGASGEDGSDDSESGDEGEEDDADERSGLPKILIVSHKPTTDDKRAATANASEWRYRASEHPEKYSGIPMKELHARTITSSLDSTYTPLPYVSNKPLATQIRRYLLARTASHMVGGHRKGTLDTGALWKGVVYRGTKAGEKVFKQKDVAVSVDTAVTLLLDQSGSMFSQKRLQYAAAAAITMNDVFSKVGVKCRIASFKDTSYTTLDIVIKDFNEKANAKQLEKLFLKAWSYDGSGNADGENIMYEYAKLVEYDAPKKVLIVLSDGMPADSKGVYNVTDFTIEVCNQIERERKVSLFGIGICTDSVKAFYRRNRVIDNPSMIEETVISLLKEVVLHA